MQYRNLRGSLAFHRRLEQSIGWLSYLVSAAAGMKKEGGGKFALADFLPHEKPRESDDEEAPDDMTFAQFLQAIK